MRWHENMGMDDIKRYKEFEHWLRHDLKQIPLKKPKIWQAFKRHAGYGPWISFMLVWGSAPAFLVEEAECEPDDRVDAGTFVVQTYKKKQSGFTAPTGKVIVIAADLVSRGSAVGALTNEKTMLEATVLHELVHWCRFKTGKDVNDEGPPYAFEREAYGRAVERSWRSCFSEILLKPN
jgi:hypothetical protein